MSYINVYISKIQSRWCQSAYLNARHLCAFIKQCKGNCEFIAELAPLFHLLSYPQAFSEELVVVLAHCSVCQISQLQSSVHCTEYFSSATNNIIIISGPEEYAPMTRTKNNCNFEKSILLLYIIVKARASELLPTKKLEVLDGFVAG